MAPPVTYLISASQSRDVFTMPDAVECVEEAFRLYGEGKVQMPPKVYLSFEKGDLRTMPVYLPTMGVAGVKNVNVHPGNTDMPTVMATITLVDPANGFPIAVMDATYLTSLRTGAAGGVAARHLARRDSSAAGFIGTGVQAHTQLDALMVTMPAVRKVLAFDVDSGRAGRFCAECAERYGLETVQSPTAAEVVNQSDILTTATPSREPVVQGEWVRPGTHINAIGADAQGKQELDPAILKAARVVLDNWEQASHSGEVNVPLSKGLITRQDIACDIGELVAGVKKGRQGPDDVTVFDSTGLAVQDVTCAFAIYRRLVSDDNARCALTRFEFF